MNEQIQSNIGILSDAHGNAIGLKKCLDFLLSKNVSKIFYLGDTLGYLPDAEKVITMVREHCELVLQGNHEAMLLGQLTYSKDREIFYKLDQAKSTISEENKNFLESLKPRKEITLGGRKVLLVHASPRDPVQGYIYPDTEIDPSEMIPYDAVFMGHTHRPFIKQLDNTLVANVGSCGLSRDYGLLSSCLIYNTNSNTAEIFRIPLTFEEIQKQYGHQIHLDVLDVFKRTSETIIGTKI